MKNKTWIFAPFLAMILMLSPALNGQETIIFGNMGDSTSSDACGDALNYIRYQCPTTMNASKIHCNIAVSGTLRIKCAIYSDKDGVADTLMRSTEEFTALGAGWKTFNLTSPLRLEEGVYYIIAVRTESPGSGYRIGCSDGLPGTPYQSPIASWDWPSPWGTVNDWPDKTYLMKVEGTSVPTKMDVVRKSNNFKVFPNPVADELTIEMNDSDIRNFEIYNSVGQSIFKGKISQKAVINTSNFTPGFYSVKIEKGNSVEFRKIVKL